MNHFRQHNLLITASLLSQLYCCRTPPRDGAASAPKLEVDDRLTPESQKLVDVSAKIETFVNQGLNKIRTQYKNDPSLIESDFHKFAGDVSTYLTKARKKSGIVILGFTIVPYTEVEAWALETLDPKNNEILVIPFDQSRYKDNPVGVFCARVPSHMHRSLSDFTVGPVIKVHQTLIGVDKLSHFLEQGFWYYDAKLSAAERHGFGQYMEGDPSLAKDQYAKYQRIFTSYCGSCSRFGHYGSEASGVISFADMEANESGFNFYKQLEKDPLHYHFSLSDYPYDKWNEVNTPSQYARCVTATDQN